MVGRAQTAVVASARPLLLEGLAAALADDLQVVDRIRPTSIVTSVAEHRPDLLVLAVRGREDEPFGAVARATSGQPGLKVLVVADAASVTELREAVVAGVQSLLLGDAEIAEVRRAALATLAGERVLDPEVAIQLAGSWSGDQGAAAAALTARELDVLGLLAEGMTNKDIGTELTLSPRTVKTHVQNLLVKLDTPDRTGAVAQGFRRGLIV
jgi:DNA-binding NarL/FixJ family response regulator